MDFRRLASQLVRARRGNRTQKALSRALGYKSNALFAWERGHDQPSARAFFLLVEKTGTLPSLSAFCRDQAPDLRTKAGVGLLLRTLAAGRKLSELSEALDRDRYAVSRWLRGQTEIPLSELLQFVEVTTLVLYDFIQLFVDPAQLEEAAEGYRKLVAARLAIYETPWAHAVVHLADLPSYRELLHHQPGWFASRLGVSMHEEELCLQHLVESGQLEEADGRYRRAEALTVDTRIDPEATRRLAAFWLKEGAKRVLTPGSGRFAFNTFAVSLVDLEKIKLLQSEYFRKLRSIVARSEPTEAVAVATFQLLTLGVEEKEIDHKGSP
jgi:transcriptional regulator with XRE-family HTH domain